jgi:hypothetical protein
MNTQHNFKSTSHEEAVLLPLASESMPAESHHGKTFTSADLWNIQRQKKMIVRRRYLG